MQTLSPQNFSSRQRSLVSFLLAGLILVLFPGLGFSSSDTGSGESTATEAARQILIEVNGRPLTGPFSTAEKRGARIFLPLGAITKELGDTVNINMGSQIIEVRRHTGQFSELDLKLRQIRENGAAILGFSDVSGITLSPDVQLQMLPLEWISALLGVPINYDAAAKIVRITEGIVRSGSRVGVSRGPLEIYNLDYEYNFNSFGSYRTNGLILRSTGRIGSGRYDLIANGVSGPTNLNLVGPVRSATLTFDDPKGRRFIGGDLGTGTDMQFFASNLRGAWGQLPLGSTHVTAFAGRSISGVSGPVMTDQEGTSTQSQQFTNNRYDTFVMGGYATLGGHRSGSPNGGLTFSTGAVHFSGEDRSGDMAAANTLYTSSRTRLRADFALGHFKGIRDDGTRANGSGIATDITGSYDVTDDLTVQGRYSYVGRNFLGMQAGLFAPGRIVAGGASWRPTEWLSTSFYGSLNKRFDNGIGRNSTDKNFAFSVNISPRADLPTVYFSHTQTRTAIAGNSAFTTLNVTKDFSRFRAFVNASRNQTAGRADLYLQVGGNVKINDRNNLVATESFGSGGRSAGTIDWYSSGLMGGRLSFGAGLGYSSGSKPPAGSESPLARVYLTQRVSASIRLPKQTSLQFAYSYNQAGGSQMQVSLRGSLFRRRESSMLMNVPVDQIKDYGAVSGRVYQDNNLNGKYDAGLDTPQPNVQVRVDGNRYATSDQNGIYRIDNVLIGDHEAYIDLLSVRADLTILDKYKQQLIMVSGHDSTLDFRLVRTGRVSGTVWYDRNGNGEINAGEEPLSDVRIVCANGSDALTDETGSFTIGDLAPGDQVLTLDEKTLPDGTKAILGSFPVTVRAGAETVGLKLAVIQKPPIVKKF